jgi:RNA polymerase sigma factor (TIGR02999 family)
MLKKFRPRGQADRIITNCPGCGEKTRRRANNFDARGRKRFQDPLQESGEDETWRCLRLSVPPMNDVTRILSAIEQGDPHAAEQLLPLVYQELRALAAQRLAQEKPGQTLQATALVHEAYLRLVDVDKVQRWDSRGHFFAAAAEAMRRILLNRARDKKRIKRGAERQRVDLGRIEIALDTNDEQLIELDEALTQLAAEDADAARLVNLRFFAGLTLKDAAVALGLSQRTAERQWAYARAWLYARLRQDAGPDAD